MAILLGKIPSHGRIRATIDVVIPGGNGPEVDNFICHMITMNLFIGTNPCDMYWQ